MAFKQFFVILFLSCVAPILLTLKISIWNPYFLPKMKPLTSNTDGKLATISAIKHTAIYLFYKKIQQQQICILFCHFLWTCETCYFFSHNENIYKKKKRKHQLYVSIIERQKSFDKHKFFNGRNVDSTSNVFFFCFGNIAEKNLEAENSSSYMQCWPTNFMPLCLNLTWRDLTVLHLHWAGLLVKNSRFGSALVSVKKK